LQFNDVSLAEEVDKLNVRPMCRLMQLVFCKRFVLCCGFKTAYGTMVGWANGMACHVLATIAGSYRELEGAICTDIHTFINTYIQTDNTMKYSEYMFKIKYSSKSVAILIGNEADLL
jgi:hypothetical protein